MKNQTSWGSRSRRQERLYAQRRGKVLQQFEQATRDVEQCHQREQRNGSTRVDDWWSPDVGEDAIRLASTSSRFCCNLPVQQSVTDHDRLGGSPSQNSTSSSTLIRSWKTLELRKACDSWSSAQPALSWIQPVGVSEVDRSDPGCVRDPDAAVRPATGQPQKISSDERSPTWGSVKAQRATGEGRRQRVGELSSQLAGSKASNSRAEKATVPRPIPWESGTGLDATRGGERHQRVART
jgi:hypothetical protein